MNKNILNLCATIMATQAFLALPAYSQTSVAAPVIEISAMESELANLQNEWAVIKYQMPNKDKQSEAITNLSQKMANLAQKYPTKAETLIWQGIVLATKAGINGGLGALSDAKAARKVLEQAETIDASALNGSVYTSLGSLYYKVPGFPLGFGNNEKAKEYLEKALAMNPNGIDPNFFYGEFLFEEGEYTKAEQVLNHALQAPSRPGRELADKGRAEEIRDLLAKVQRKKG